MRKAHLRPPTHSVTVWTRGGAYHVGNFTETDASTKVATIAREGFWAKYRFYPAHAITAIDMEPIPNGQAPT